MTFHPCLIALTVCLLCDAGEWDCSENCAITVMAQAFVVNPPLERFLLGTGGEIKPSRS